MDGCRRTLQRLDEIWLDWMGSAEESIEMSGEFGHVHGNAHCLDVKQWAHEREITINSLQAYLTSIVEAQEEKRKQVELACQELELQVQSLRDALDLALEGKEQAQSPNLLWQRISRVCQEKAKLETVWNAQLGEVKAYIASIQCSFDELSDMDVDGALLLHGFTWQQLQENWITRPSEKSIREAEDILERVQTLRLAQQEKIRECIHAIQELQQKVGNDKAEPVSETTAYKDLVSRREHLQKEWEQRQERFLDLVGRIQDMAVEMSKEVPELPSDQVLSDSVLSELESIVASWMEEWQEYRMARIRQLMTELKERYTLYHIPNDIQQEFYTSLGDDTTSEHVYILLRKEISRLDRDYQDAIPLLDAIAERLDHIQKMKAFENSASDPRRLFRSSFQLNEEEKFRKIAFPTLLRMEESIRDKLSLYEKNKGKPFVWEGQPYAERLQAEVEGRFVNDTVFEFSSSTASTRKLASSPGKSGTKPSPSLSSSSLPSMRTKSGGASTSGATTAAAAVRPRKESKSNHSVSSTPASTRKLLATPTTLTRSHGKNNNKENLTHANFH